MPAGTAPALATRVFASWDSVSTRRITASGAAALAAESSTASSSTNAMRVPKPRSQGNARVKWRPEDVIKQTEVLGIARPAPAWRAASTLTRRRMSWMTWVISPR
jgi:hypothetical protein